MSEPNWAIVLRTLHEDQTVLDPSDLLDEASLAERIAQRTDLSTMDARKALDYLNEVNLVSEIDMAGGGSIGALTERGFNVAHERELRERKYELAGAQKNANETLADFTIILGVTALIQALAAVVSAPKYTTPLAIVYLILLVLILYFSDDLFHR